MWSARELDHQMPPFAYVHLTLSFRIKRRLEIHCFTSLYLRQAYTVSVQRFSGCADTSPNPLLSNDLDNYSEDIPLAQITLVLRSADAVCCAAALRQNRDPTDTDTISQLSRTAKYDT